MVTKKLKGKEKRKGKKLEAFFTFRVNLLFFEALLEVFFNGEEEFFELGVRACV